MLYMLRYIAYRTAAKVRKKLPSFRNCEAPASLDRPVGACYTVSLMLYSTKRFGLLATILAAGTALAAAPDIAVVPAPREISTVAGVYKFEAPARIACATSDRPAANAVASEIQRDGGKAQVLTQAAAPAAIRIGKPDDPVVHRALIAAKALNRVPTQPESYLLLADAHGVTLAARDGAGLYWGAQTLRQLLRVDRGAVTVPRVTIRDWPAMAFRGLSVDLGQGAIPTEEELRSIIATCAEYKLNVVSFYVQHLLPLRLSPLMAPRGAALDPETVQRLQRFAELHHVMLVPQQQTFGHLHRLLKYEKYAGLSEVQHGATLAPGVPAVYDWVEDAVDEWTKLLPGPYFHAGGDETRDLGKGVSHAAAATPGGLQRLWTEHMTRVAAIARRHGRRTMFWSDVPLQSPEVIAGLPHDMIAAAWTYEPNSHFADFVTPFRKAGLDVIVCPSVNNWNKPAPDFEVAIKNIGGFVAEGQRQGALGMLNTVWFDDGESLFDSVWYPVLYSADASWRGADVPREEFDHAFDWAFYRSAGTAFAGVIQKLGQIHATVRKAGVHDADDEYVWLDPFSGRGAGIYAKLQPQAHEIRILAEDALTTLLQSRSQARLHTATLDYLDFAARRYDWLGMRVQYAGEIASLYQTATAHTDDSGAVTYSLAKISGVNGRVQDLRNYAGEMKQEYQTLWLAANHPYMLNSMLALYDRELLFWLDKATRISQVRTTYRKEHTLPPLASLGMAER